jgi:transcriptional regulator with XRE-family HTH domain
MKKTIRTASDLGLVLRGVRTSQGLRQDDLAAMSGVGSVFAGAVERGKDSVHLGKVLKLLEEAGVTLIAEYADSAKDSVEVQFAKGVRPVKPRVAKVEP